MICSTLNPNASICLFFFRVLCLTFLRSLSLLQYLVPWENVEGGKKTKNLHILQYGGSRKQTTETEQINITEREQQKSCTRLMWRETTAGPKPRWKPVPRGVFNKQNIWFNAPRPTVPICVFTITIESQCKPALKSNYFLSFEESLCMWCVSKVQAVEWRSPLILLG